MKAENNPEDWAKSRLLSQNLRPVSFIILCILKGWDKKNLLFRTMWNPIGSLKWVLEFASRVCAFSRSFRYERRDMNDKSFRYGKNFFMEVYSCLVIRLKGSNYSLSHWNPKFTKFVFNMVNERLPLPQTKPSMKLFKCQNSWHIKNRTAIKNSWSTRSISPKTAQILHRNAQWSKFLKSFQL